MSSPFAIFRKNSKIAMAALVFMAMFAFVVADPLMQMTNPNPNGGGEVIARTKAGNLTEREISILAQRRELANYFIDQAFQEARFTEGMQFMELRAVESERMRAKFGFGRPRRQDIVLGFLFEQEAKRLGIQISDDAVMAFIDRFTANRLSTEKFREIVSTLNTTRKDLFDAIRGELAARIAFQMAVPQTPPTPEQLWKIHRQLRVEQSLEVAAVPVEAFISTTREPSQPEVRELFEKYQANFPDQYPDFGPGFRQPRRVRLQYLSAAFAATEKTVPPVSDADVLAYYEKNKDALYRDTSLPDDAAGNTDKPLDPQFTPEEGAAPEKPADEKPESDKPANDTPAPEKPAEEKPATEKPAEEKPADEKSADEKSASDTPEGTAQFSVAPEQAPAEAAAEQPAEETPAAETPAKETPAPEKPAAETPAEPAAKEPPAETKPAETKPAETTPPETTSEETPPAEGTSAEPATETPAEPPKYKPLDDDLKEAIRQELHRERTIEALQKLGTRAVDAMTELQLKYGNSRALDGKYLYVDWNENGKRDDGEPFVEATDVKLEALTPEQNAALDAETAKIASKELARIGARLGMTWNETALVSAQELRQLPGIGSVGDINADPNKLRMIDELTFTDEIRYRPLKGFDVTSQDLYVLWKVEDIDTHIPKLTDPGIEAQVVAAWQIEQARPLAEKRANELAEIARKSQNPMFESLGPQTVTGAKDGPKLTVMDTPNFSWLRESSVPGQDMFSAKPPPQLSRIPFVERAGTEFMSTVFDKLQPGEFGVAPNENRTVFYVVHVQDRVPATAEGLKAMREEFFKQNLFGFNIPGLEFLTTPYQDVSREYEQQNLLDWVRRLEERYGLQWTDPADKM